MQSELGSVVTRDGLALFPTYTRLPIGAVQSAHGVTITTETGEYLDALSGLGVMALGHGHPKVLSAIREQAERYLHLSNLFFQEPQVRLAEQLEAASGFERVFFSNTGTEAVEGALKLARRHFKTSEKTEIVGMANSFHGRTLGALSVMDKVKYRAGYGPFIPGFGTSDWDSAALTCAVTDRTAAVIVEAIQGEGGIIEIPAEAVATLHTLRDRFGFLIIADEIQSGIGRTGDFFAFEGTGLRPDIVVCAKAIGGGLPLGAILTSSVIAQAMAGGVHGTTFGGNALSCVAGSVVVSEVTSTYQAHARSEGDYLKSGLCSIAAQHSKVVDGVRGRGMMLGLQFHETETGIAKRVEHHMLETSHVIANATGHEVLRLLPPLVFQRSDSDAVLSAIERAITDL